VQKNFRKCRFCSACVNEVHLKKACVDLLSQFEDYCMTGLEQHGVWRGCADCFAVRLNLLEAEVFEDVLYMFEAVLQ
jgi:hypothetical protein